MTEEALKTFVPITSKNSASVLPLGELKIYPLLTVDAWERVLQGWKIFSSLQTFCSTLHSLRYKLQENLFIYYRENCN